MNQWVTGRACISTYQVSDPRQRYWRMWGDTVATEYSGEIYTGMEGADRCGMGAFNPATSFREHIDRNGTYGTLGNAYQGTYLDCGSNPHQYRLTSWHYRRWVGGTQWDAGWNYGYW